MKKDKQFTTIEKEMEQKGIFFRLPFQKVEKDIWSENLEGAYGWFNRAQKTILPILYNWKIFNKCKNGLFDEDNLAAIYVNEIVSPIYFKRTIRKAHHKFNKDHIIDHIDVYGYEPYKNNCSGRAEKEITKIIFKDGKKKKIITREIFKYVYKHIIEKEFL